MRRPLERVWWKLLTWLLAASILLPLCNCGGTTQPPGGGRPEDPDAQPDPPVDDGPSAGTAAPDSLIRTAAYDPADRSLSFSVESADGLPVDLHLELPAGISSLGGQDFHFPSGDGGTRTQLVFSELGEMSSTLSLSAWEDGGEPQSTSLSVRHPRLEVSSAYDPASHVLTVGAVHPYGEAVNLKLTPSLGLSLDGPLEYSFLEGLGTRVYTVKFDNPQISSGSVQLDFSAPRCTPLQLEEDVSLSRIITDIRWLLPENILRVSLDNGYSAGAQTPVSVECLCPAGISVLGDRMQSLPGSGGELEFRLSFGETPPASYELRLRAGDSLGHSEERSYSISRLPPSLPAGALQIYPLANHVRADEPLTFVVATGRTSIPLLFMSGVALTFHPGGSYVADSFNIGAPGGEFDDPDGVWAACMAAGGYITSLDERYAAPQALLGQRKLLTFNITPLLGREMADAEGALFNFQLRFSQAGTYSVEVLDHPIYDVPQTYYQNFTAPLVYWDDISGDHPGVPCEVVVE